MDNGPFFGQANPSGFLGQSFLELDDIQQPGRSPEKVDHAKIAVRIEDQITNYGGNTKFIRTDHSPHGNGNKLVHSYKRFYNRNCGWKAELYMESEYGRGRGIPCNEQKIDRSLKKLIF